MRHLFTPVPHLILAWGYMTYINGDGEDFVKGLLGVLLVQFVIWVFYSLYSWVDYFLVRKKQLTEYYYGTLEVKKFPRMRVVSFEEDSPPYLLTEPEVYLHYILDHITGQDFSPFVRMAAAAFSTETRCLELQGELQQLKRLKMAFGAALKRYQHQDQVGDLWEVSPERHKDLNGLVGADPECYHRPSYLESLKIPATIRIVSLVSG